MKICAVSDIHGHFFDIPECDVFIIAGDINYGCHKKWFNGEFANWINNYSNNFDLALLVFGNHDDVIYMDKDIETLYHNFPTNFRILTNDGISYKGVNFYGSPNVPYIPGFKNSMSEDVLRAIYSNIDNNTDILITHAPCFGIGDAVNQGRGFSLGSKSLLERVKEVKPDVQFFGHIHTGRRYTRKFDIDFYNVSIVDESYEFVYPPTIIDYHKR